MGYNDRRQRQRELQAQRDRERREAIRTAETLEDILEIVEREYEEEIEDEDGETTTVTRTQKSSPMVQQMNDVLTNGPVQRRKVSPESVDEARTAYDNEDALELARLAFEVVSGEDPAEQEDTN